MILAGLLFPLLVLHSLLDCKRFIFLSSRESDLNIKGYCDPSLTMSDNEILRLNDGGRLITTTHTTVFQYKGSLLERMFSRWGVFRRGPGYFRGCADLSSPRRRWFNERVHWAPDSSCLLLRFGWLASDADCARTWRKRECCRTEAGSFVQYHRKKCRGSPVTSWNYRRKSFPMRSRFAQMADHRLKAVFPDPDKPTWTT